MVNDNGWPEYAKHVLAELKRHNVWLGNIDEKLDNHVTHIEHRLTSMETTQKNDRRYNRWIMGLMFTLLGAVFVTLIGILIS